VLDYAKANGKQFSTLGRILIGGSACPPNMIAAWAGYGITVRHAWGMTETSPLGTVCQLLPKHKDLPEAQKQHVLASQGRALFGARLKTVDDEGNTLPRDGKSSGHLLIQGNWIMDRYYGKPDLASENGWFRTGDVGSIDADGYVYITDRSKDVIKSGGEWISSIEIENIAMEEPLVELAACIAQADDKWGERPVLFVVPREGAELDEAHMLERYQDRVTRWSVPDKVIFIDQMPMTATGKIQKMALRKMLADQTDPS
jgi:fatty-acyl-CoA synthase